MGREKNIFKWGYHYEKRILAIVLVVIMSFSGTNMIYARDFRVSSAGHDFNGKWEETALFGNGSKLVYGYNTFLINEDYSHSNCKYSQAYLINARGTFRANAALTTTWSKIEVTHAGNFIYYGVTY